MSRKSLTAVDLVTGQQTVQYYLNIDQIVPNTLAAVDISRDRLLEQYLYVNQFDGEYLLPEFKHLDFLWLMKGDEIDPNWLNETTQAIRETPSVQLVANLSIEQIKNRENLLF